MVHSTLCTTPAESVFADIIEWGKTLWKGRAWAQLEMRGAGGCDDILPIYESFVLGLKEGLAKSKQSRDRCQVEE